MLLSAFAFINLLFDVFQCGAFFSYKFFESRKLLVHIGILSCIQIVPLFRSVEVICSFGIVLFDPVFGFSNELFFIHYAFQIIDHIRLNWPNERVLSIPFDVYSVWCSDLNIMIRFFTKAPVVLLFCMQLKSCFCFCNISLFFFFIPNSMPAECTNNETLFKLFLQLFVKFERVSFPQATRFAGIHSAF